MTGEPAILSLGVEPTSAESDIGEVNSYFTTIDNPVLEQLLGLAAPQQLRIFTIRRSPASMKVAGTGFVFPYPPPNSRTYQA